MSRDLLFEIGVEELPAGYVPPALEQLERGVREGLEGLRLGFGGIVTYGTPRRLTVVVHRIDERQADFDEEAMGPAAKVAFDSASARFAGIDREAVASAMAAKTRGVAVGPTAPSRAATASPVSIAAAISAEV